MENLLEYKDVKHRFGLTDVLHGVNFRVPRGSVTALLGPNGAGKSTALRMAVNLLAPTGGGVEVLGTPSQRVGPAEFRRLGYVADGMELPLWMTVDRFLAWCRPLYPQWDRDMEARLRKDFDLPGNRKLSQLSRGQRMKAALLSNLAYRPELLLLDEPFSGLDPVVRDEFIAGLLEMAGQEGWSILVSSHDIEEVQRLADRVVVLNYGRVLLEESTEDLLARHRAVEVLLEKECAAPPASAESWQGLTSAGRIVRFVETNYSSEAALTERMAQHLPGIASHTATPMPLRDVFVSLVKAGRVTAGN